MKQQILDGGSSPLLPQNRYKSPTPNKNGPATPLREAEDQDHEDQHENENLTLSGVSGPDSSKINKNVLSL